MGNESKVAEKFESAFDGEEAATGLMETGPSGLSREDVAPPRMSLLQGQSRAVAEGFGRPGQWYAEGFVAADTLDVSVIDVRKKRAMWLRDDDLGVAERLCASEDAVTGVGEPGGECGKCPMASWQEVKGGKNEPPACALIYEYTFWVESWGVPVLTELSKSGLNAARLLNTQILLAEAAGRSMNSVKISLGSRVPPKARFQYYAATVSKKA